MGLNLNWIVLCFCLLYADITKAHGTDDDFQDLTTYDINDDDLVKYEDCVDKHLNRNPQLGNRFSILQLTSACKRYDAWHKNYPMHSNLSHHANYTHLQKKYIDRIQYCRNYDDCYGDTLVDRRRLERLRNPNQKRQSGRLVVRRECRTLSQGELQNYIDTLNLLKNTGIDGSSKYDLLITYHLPESAPEAHFGPGFLPYHRELLKQLEVAGGRENPSFALCYWDSTLDHDLPDPTDSVLWTDFFFGNGNGDVTNGPFSNWRMTVNVPGSNGRLYRRLGMAATGGLYSSNDISNLMSRSTYTQFCSYCVDPSFEMWHAGVHDFVGGYMTYIPASPNDPVFFNHHCFIDKFWEEWRQTRQQSNRETDYPSNSQACKPQHYGTSPMSPFNLRIIDGLSDSYSSLYSYAPSPTCGNGDCSGLFLFCNTRTNRCMSKIRPGGNCRGLEDSDSCYNSVCSNGVCGQSSDRPQRRPANPPNIRPPPPPNNNPASSRNPFSLRFPQPQPSSQNVAINTDDTGDIDDGVSIEDW